MRDILSRGYFSSKTVQSAKPPSCLAKETTPFNFSSNKAHTAVGDVNAEHDIYDDDVICDYPQSGERIFGRNNLQALRSHHPGKPSGFNVRRIVGKSDLWITEYTITYQERSAYTVSIMEFAMGKSYTKHNISQIPLRHQNGEVNGLSQIVSTVIETSHAYPPGTGILTTFNS